jgi:aldose 1-epimerase
MRFAASLYNPSNGILMEVWSDQPGLQLYRGQWLDGTEIGKCGRRLERYSSFTFETQNYPDAPNKKTFPDPFLHPKEQYTHV